MEREIAIDLEKKIRSICAQFALQGNITHITRLHGGHINNTFRVTCTQGDYLLQRISRAAFPRPDHVMDNITAILPLLKEAVVARGGDPLREAMTLVPTNDGAGYLTDAEGDAWRTYLYIPDTLTFMLPENPDMLRKSALAFGDFTQTLRDFPAHTLHETIAHFHDTPARYGHLMDAFSRDAHARAAQIAPEMDFALQREPFTHVLVRQLEKGLLPLRVTHNDTKLSNVLIDKDTGNALCVIDLDTVMPGLCAYDFGDAIRFGASTAAEDEQDLARVQLSLPMFTAFAQGYIEKTAQALSPAEVDSLALGSKMMTFECGMRFLTDYLNGDTYFHTDYPTHNLVRARTQFKLVACMEEHMEQMLDICRSAYVLNKTSAV